MDSMQEQFEMFQRMLCEHPNALQLTTRLKNIVHVECYLGRETFGAVLTADGKFLRFIPHYTFH